MATNTIIIGTEGAGKSTMARDLIQGKSSKTVFRLQEYFNNWPKVPQVIVFEEVNLISNERDINIFKKIAESTSFKRQCGEQVARPDIIVVVQGKISKLPDHFKNNPLYTILEPAKKTA